jgi:hypothetical protein
MARCFSIAWTLLPTRLSLAAFIPAAATTLLIVGFVHSTELVPRIGNPHRYIAPSHVSYLLAPLVSFIVTLATPYHDHVMLLCTYVVSFFIIIILFLSEHGE